MITKLLCLFKALQLSGAGCERGYSGITSTRLDYSLCLNQQYHVIWICCSDHTLSIFIPLSVVSGLAASLPSLLISTSVSAAERKEKLNAVKMSVYLLCKLTENLESNSYRQSIVTASGKVWF